MSYYRLKADFENTFLSGRSHRSRSLPRETFSHDPYLPFTRAASVPPSDYLETSRSRFARNLRPNWYSYCQEPSYDYYSPRYSYYDNIYYGNNPRDLYYDRYSNYYDRPSSYLQSSRYLRPRNLSYDYHDYLYPSYYDDPHYNYYQSSYDASTGYESPRNYYYYNETPNVSLSDYYGSNNYNNNYTASSSSNVLGSWKMFNKSSNTLSARNARATSPLVSRELNRYFSSSGKTESVADLGSKGVHDFRHYNYGRIPYFGTSDNFHNMNLMFREGRYL